MIPTRPLYLLAAAATLAATASSQHTIRTILGDQAGANFGRAIAAVGDIDGDGKPDLVVGEPNRDYGTVQDAGAACIVASGTGTLLHRTYGTQVGGHLGGSVAGLGDTTGDGVPDWACGAPDAVTGSGAVRVLSGATGLAYVTLTGAPFARFGAAICGLDDINSDGRGEFAISSPVPTPTNPTGRIQLFFGPTGAPFAQYNDLGIANNTRFGTSLLQGSDITGDGKRDLLIGEPGHDGNGQDAGNVRARSLSQPTYHWQASGSFGAGQEGGGALAELGDVDGDGKSDFLATTGANMVVALAGATGGVLFYVQNQDFGTDPSIACVGDWNGDGFVDFAVGSGSAAFGEGRVWIYSTGTGRGLLRTIDGTPASGFGTSLAALGDLDGDGRDELAVGAPTHMDNGIVVGRVSIHSYTVNGINASFGQGCTNGPIAPLLHVSGQPRLGRTLTHDVTQIVYGNFGMLLFGFSRSNYAGIPLPASLQPYGSPCTLYVSIDASLPFVASTSADFHHSMVLPTAPVFAGTRLYSQAVQFYGSMPGGLLFTNANEIRIGS